MLTTHNFCFFAATFFLLYIFHAIVFNFLLVIFLFVWKGTEKFFLLVFPLGRAGKSQFLLRQILFLYCCQSVVKLNDLAQKNFFTCVTEISLLMKMDTRVVRRE